MDEKNLETELSSLKDSGLIERSKCLALRHSKKSKTLYNFRTGTKHKFKEKDLKIIYYDGTTAQDGYLKIHYRKNLVLYLDEEENEAFPKLSGFRLKLYKPGLWELKIETIFQR